MQLLKEGDMVLCVARDRKQYLFRLAAGQALHTNRGTIPHNELIGTMVGREVRTHQDYPFLILEPSTTDLIRTIKRNTQIMFPKDVSYMLFRLNIFTGRRVIEAGTGSGGLTLALTRQVMPQGHVFSYEINPEAQALARRNLDQLGLLPYVELKERDIADGFDETLVDAVFLDLRHPWRYLAQAGAALKPGGFFGAILPTTTQVSELLEGLQRHGEFAFNEVEELLLRPYKAVPARLRPADRMVAHTGYLVFSRRVTGGLDEGWALPTRGRRHLVEAEED